MAHSDPVIKEQLLDELYRGEVTAPCDGDLRDAVNFDEYSNNAVQRAMGSLIKDGQVVRQRQPMESLHHQARPVTWRLSRQHN